MTKTSRSYNQHQLKVICDSLCDNIENLLEILSIDNIKTNGKMLVGECPIHNGDNKSAFNLYPDGDNYRGNWKCRTHNCDKIFKGSIIGFIRGVLSNKKYPIPAVAKSHKFFKINNQSVTFSRKNIFIRDDYTCQYCGKKYELNHLTYDHVIPKSKWKSIKDSPTCWTNIVTACVWCNRKKGSKTPKEANMPLKNFPIKPNKNTKYLPITTHLLKIKDQIPTEWNIYLPDSYL